jgi:hypothetical protein
VRSSITSSSNPEIHVLWRVFQSARAIAAIRDARRRKADIRGGLRHARDPAAGDASMATQELKPFLRVAADISRGRDSRPSAGASPSDTHATNAKAEVAI